MKQIYFNGDIITMEGPQDKKEAVLVEDGMIQYVGSLKKARELGGNESKWIDLCKRTLMPSFIDPHGHITLQAQFSEFANLSGCVSFQDIVDTLKKYKEENQVGEDGVILGFGYDHNFLEEERHPDKFVLDQVLQKIPIFIFHASGHMGVANSALLRLAEIDKHTKDPKGGRLGRIENSMEPNGYAEESAAVAKVVTCVFSRIKGDFTNQIKKAQQVYLSHGITTVQDGASTRDDVRKLSEAAEKGLLTVDVVSYVLVNEEPLYVMTEYKKYDKTYQNRFKIGGWKIILDGSPQGRSAWLSQPYEGEADDCGYPIYETEEMRKYVKAAVDNGCQLLAHCNGDAASEQYIRAYKKAVEESNYPDKKNLRPVMIHCQTVRKDQLDRMAELSMIPSIFVAHTYYWGDIHLKNLGLQRGNHISPAKSAFERGLKVNFHQDTPVVAPDMLHTVWCGVNRITRKGVTIGPDERISVYDALKAVTINGAYAYFEEEIKGSIKAGKIADLVILDKNPLKVHPFEIRNIQVLETIKEGKTVFKK